MGIPYRGWIGNVEEDWKPGGYSPDNPFSEENWGGLGGVSRWKGTIAEFYRKRQARDWEVEAGPRDPTLYGRDYEPPTPGEFSTPPPELDTGYGRGGVDDLYDDIFPDEGGETIGGKIEPPPLDLGEGEEGGGTDVDTGPGTGKGGTGTETGGADVPPSGPDEPSGEEIPGGDTGDVGIGGEDVDPSDPEAPVWNPTNWMQDWNTIQSTFVSITDTLSQIPYLQQYITQYGDVFNDLQELIQSRGAAGLTQTFEEQYGQAATAASRAAQKNYSQMLGNMVRRGILTSGVTASAASDIEKELNHQLVTMAGAIQGQRSQMAASFYSQAISQKQQLINSLGEQGLDTYDAWMRYRQLEGQENLAIREMGLREKLAIMGQDADIYKTQIQASIERERLNLEEKLGFANIDMRKYLADREWDLDKAALDLQEELGLGQLELDRWKALLQSEIASRRNDIDLLNVMGTLRNDEWQLAIQEQELKLRQWMGEEEFNLRREEMGQDWAMFLEDQAMKEWISRGSWASAAEVARLYKDSGGGSWLGDVLSFAGGVIGG